MGWRMVWTWAGFTGEATDIDPRFAQVADINEPAKSMAQVRVRFKPRGISSVAAICNSGVPLYTGTAILYYDDRVVLDGRWSPESEYGADDEPVQVVIRESAGDDVGSFPPIGEMPVSRDRRVELELAGFRPGYATNRTLPLFYASGTGEGYPVVFGSPGDDVHPGSPCPVVSDGSIASISVMAHAGAATGTATIWGPEKNASSPGLMSYSDTLSTGTDNLGCRYVGVTFNSADVTRPDWQPNGSSYYASWNGTASGLPGGAGDVLLAALSRSTARIDMGSARACVGLLNRYQLDGFVNDRVSPLQWVTNTLLPMLPIALVPSSSGLRVAPLPWVDQVDDFVYHLEEGPGMARASGVTWSALEGVAACRILFGWDPSMGTYISERTASASDVLSGRRAATLDPSRATIVDTESRMVWDAATAERMARDVILRNSIPRRRIAYMCRPDLYGYGGALELRAGMPIRMTDAGLRLSRMPAVVSRIERDGEAMRIDVDLRDEGLRG